jgi:hypothetical protein
VPCLAFSPDGTVLASVLNDRYNDTHVQLWQLIDKAWLRRVALILLRANVAPYVALDIVDFVGADAAITSLADESTFMHLEKINCITRVQQRLQQSLTL